MADEQMKKLLEAITSMTSALAQQQATTSTSINIISNFEPFNPNTETFQTYKERLEIHFQLKGVFDNKDLCAKLLLQYVGSDNYTTLSTLAAPKSVSDMKYEEIISLLEQQFCPRRNILVEQHRFLSEVQNENQTIADFVTTLQKRASTCEFVCVCQKSVADIFSRAQFIRGLRDNTIREQLLQKPEDSFSQIVEKAKILEAAKINYNEISNTTSDVHHMRQSTIDHQKSGNRYQNKRSALPLSTKVNYKDLGIEGLCLRCGKGNHLSNECKIDKNKLRCSICKKVGHVKEVCITTKLQQRKQNSYTTSYVESYSSDDDGINQIIDIYNKTIIPSPELKKFFTTVLINGRKQTFEVDSGAGYTLIPKSDFDQLNLKIPIEKTSIAFRSYTGDIFVPIGVVNVKVVYKAYAVISE
ncbi:uncharacterized protein LOC142224700 [Haematobia irritans]|uniref:uncharacterized protein LOC142224700 n=1 Tax=Haematobia irritans TaxID=7368 RepID=UPI003F50C7D7